MQSPHRTVVSQSLTVVHCDLPLAQRLERAEGLANAEYVDARAKVFSQVGCEWIEVAGAHAMFDGVESPCTQTFGLGCFEPVTDADLERLEAFFHERASDTVHEISSLAEMSLMARLCERGYQPVELSTVLVRPIQPASADRTPASALNVRTVEAGEHMAWARTSAAGWADVAAGFEEFILQLGQVNPLRPNTHCFVAEYEGEAIATGAICLFGGVAVLAGASTVPPRRRLGAQLALLERRLAFAADRGCDLAMIVTQPGSASQRNAERQGFRVAYTRTKWRRGIVR